jgi:hypothetical protein
MAEIVKIEDQKEETNNQKEVETDIQEFTYENGMKKYTSKSGLVRYGMDKRAGKPTSLDKLDKKDFDYLLFWYSTKCTLKYISRRIPEMTYSKLCYLSRKGYLDDLLDMTDMETLKQRIEGYEKEKNDKIKFMIKM